MLKDLEKLGFRHFGIFKIKSENRIEFVSNIKSLPILSLYKSGVYVFCENDVVKYVGECKGFIGRMGNYERPPKGAETSKRVNKLIYDSLNKSNEVIVYFLEEEKINNLVIEISNNKNEVLLTDEKLDRKAVERILINVIKPEWNKE
jgi:hypothetical protein